MKTQQLGNDGPMISVQGLGLMGMSEFYGKSDDEQSIRTIHQTIDLGVNFFDTADMYGRGHNEQLLGRALREWSGDHDKLVIATKFGIVRSDNPMERGINGSPEYVKSACDTSLQRLGLDTIDLYYQHRVDPEVPIEETVGAMAELVQAGKVRYLGLSEASAATIRRAMNVHPIAALQTEYSLWTRDIEDEILPTTNELGITLVAYSPLGRGFLTGKYKNPSELGPGDFRNYVPRLQGEHLQQNLALVEKLEGMAESKGCTPAQLALAWVHTQEGKITSIPGTRRSERVKENLAALDVDLTAEDLATLAEWFAPENVAGLRYPEAAMKSVNA